MRTAARLSAQVRHVPYLLQDTGRRGTHPWRDEVELVMATATTAAKNLPKRAPAGIVSDPIADMLTRVRNANSARHPEVRVPASRLTPEIAPVPREESYITGKEIES